MFSDAFMAIADPNRRHLLEELRRGPKTVNELAAGLPQESIKVPVYAGLDRLATVFPSREAFMALAKSLPHYQPWPPWERLFDYELVDVQGGVSFRTQREAPWEDEQYRLHQDPYALWAALTMPVLLVRAAQRRRIGECNLCNGECRTPERAKDGDEEGKFVRSQLADEASCSGFH